MSKYSLEEKAGFTVLGIGIDLKSDYTDFMGINKEKADFLQATKADGSIEKLKTVAENNYFFEVSEAVNNKMMYYVGVLSKATIPEATRSIEFPEGQYVVVKGEAPTSEELSNLLTGIAFGQVLSEIKEYAYVGGPNTVVETEKREDTIVGEIWIPVVKQ